MTHLHFIHPLVHTPSTILSCKSCNYLFIFLFSFSSIAFPRRFCFFHGFRLYTRREEDGVMYGNGTLLFNRKGNGFGVKFVFFSHWTREPEH